mgnify:CR=1 FL=1
MYSHSPTNQRPNTTVLASTGVALAGRGKGTGLTAACLIELKQSGLNQGSFGRDVSSVDTRSQSPAERWAFEILGYPPPLSRYIARV